MSAQPRAGTLLAVPSQETINTLSRVRRPLTSPTCPTWSTSDVYSMKRLHLCPAVMGTDPSPLSPCAHRHWHLQCHCRFLWSDYTVEVRLNDYLDIICPHYEEGSVDPRAMERYTLYLVELEEYQACKPRSKEQIRWECDKPSALHGPEKFSEKFQRFTPFTLGKEFREGHSYYYISKPIHHHSEACLKLKVTVTGKGTPAPPVPASTQKGRIQADDAAAHVLRSVGQNSAMRSSSRPFTFISLLLPLLVPQGL